MRRKYTVEKDPDTGRKVYKSEDIPDTPEATASEKLLTLLEKLTDKVQVLAQSVWEAIGDLRKNVGDVRLQAGANYQELKGAADRAWSLNESRNSVHRKAAEELLNALQRMNERLSKVEGNVLDKRVVEGQIKMLSECIGAHNERLVFLEIRADHTDERLPTFTTPYSLKDGGILEITTTLPNGEGERVSAKTYTKDEYAAHIRSLTQQQPAGQKAVVWQQGHVTIPERDAR